MKRGGARGVYKNDLTYGDYSRGERVDLPYRGRVCMVEGNQGIELPVPGNDG